MRFLSRGGALIEFALTWPVALLLVLGAVQVALWTGESFAARSAVVAGARAGSAAGGNADLATRVAVRALEPNVFGADVRAGCAVRTAQSELWICARDLGSEIEVDVDGAVPALVPLLPGRGLPIHAHVVLAKEVFAR